MVLTLLADALDFALGALEDLAELFVVAAALEEPLRLAETRELLLVREAEEREELLRVDRDFAFAVDFEPALEREDCEDFFDFAASRRLA